MVALEDRDEIIFDIIEHFNDKMKKASKNNDVLKSVIGHLIAEIKHEADKLRVNDDDDSDNSKIYLDLVVDFIAEVWITLLCS